MITKKRFTNTEILALQERIDALAKKGFKPGDIRSRSTQSFTKAMTAKFIKATSNDASLMIGNCESYDARIQRSSDLFGLLDLLAVTSSLTRGIQACGSDWQAHIDKFLDDLHIERCARWLASPSRTLELWGWTQHKRFLKNGQRGKNKVWLPRCQLITMAFLEGKEPATFIDLLRYSWK